MELNISAEVFATQSGLFSLLGMTPKYTFVLEISCFSAKITKFDLITRYFDISNFLLNLIFRAEVGSILV